MVCIIALALAFLPVSAALLLGVAYFYTLEVQIAPMVAVTEIPAPSMADVKPELPTIRIRRCNRRRARKPEGYLADDEEEEEDRLEVERSRRRLLEVPLHRQAARQTLPVFVMVDDFSSDHSKEPFEWIRWNLAE